MKNKKKYEKMVDEALRQYFKHIHEMLLRKSVNILFTEEKTNDSNDNRKRSV